MSLTIATKQRSYSMSRQKTVTGICSPTGLKAPRPRQTRFVRGFLLPMAGRWWDSVRGADVLSVGLQTRHRPAALFCRGVSGQHRKANLMAKAIQSPQSDSAHSELLRAQDDASIKLSHTLAILVAVAELVDAQEKPSDTILDCVWAAWSMAKDAKDAIDLRMDAARLAMRNGGTQ